MAMTESERRRQNRINVEHQSGIARLEEVRAAEERRLTGVSDVVADHEGRIRRIRRHLGDLTARVLRTDQCVEDVNARLDVQGSHIRELRTRVGSLEDSSRTPLYVWVISVIVGVVAAIVWAGIDFVQIVDVNETTRFRFVYEYADAWWCAILIGVAAFALVWALLPRFARRSEVEETEEQVEPVQGQTTATPPAEIPQEDTTEQMPAVTTGR